MKKLALIPMVLFATGAFAQFEANYNELSSKASVRCSFYKEDPSLIKLGSDVVFQKHIKTSYKYLNQRFDVKVSKEESESLWGNSKKTVVTLIANNIEIEGKIKRKNFIQFNLKSLDRAQAEVAQVLRLSSLSCAVDIAVETPHRIKKENVHINVHPHTQYDVMDRATPVVNKLFKNKSFEQVILLDDYNMKGVGFNVSKFLDGGFKFNYKDLRSSKKILFPINAAIKVSPAGHNSYSFNTQSLNVDYTGGNHNYCMWNNTRRVLDAFFRGSKNEKVTFNYNKKGIVVQKGGIIDGLSIDRNVFGQSNLLDDVFNRMSNKDLLTYHSSYYGYFKNSFLTPKKHLFSKVHLIYNGKVRYSESIIGSGDKEYTIEFNYL